MDAWERQGADAWESLTPGDWRSAGQPAALPADPPRATPVPPAHDQAALQTAIMRAIGGPIAALPMPTGDTVAIDAAALAAHLPADQASFAPFLSELVNDPAEIWLRFERHKGTGRVVLRQRLIKLLQLDKRRRLLMVLQASGGSLDAFTVLQDSDRDYLQSQRVGRLLWSRS